MPSLNLFVHVSETQGQPSFLAVALQRFEQGRDVRGLASLREDGACVVRIEDVDSRVAADRLPKNIAVTLPLFQKRFVIVARSKLP